MAVKDLLFAKDYGVDLCKADELLRAYYKDSVFADEIGECMKVYKVRDRITGKYFNGFREGAEPKDHQVNLFLSDFGRTYDKAAVPKSIVTKMMRMFKDDNEKILFCKYDLEVVEFDLVEVKK